MKSLIIALLLACAALAGCQDTTFEGPPSDKIATCDPHFVGKWRLLSSDDKSHDALFVIVERGCKKWRFIEDGKDDLKTEQTTHLSFASAGNVPLLLLKIDSDKPAENDPQARWTNGYYYLRYEFADKAIRLYPSDHRHIAHLLVDGTISGRTERITREPVGKPAAQAEQPLKTSGRDELHNFVAGDAQEMARVAQLEGMFDTSNSYLLKPASDAEIFKAAKKTPAKP